MRKFLSALCVCLFALVFRIHAQHHVQCDALGNTYDVCADHIKKHSSNFNIDYRLSTLQYGTSVQLDLTYPLVPFLFFEDQGFIAVHIFPKIYDIINYERQNKKNHKKT